MRSTVGYAIAGQARGLAERRVSPRGVARGVRTIAITGGKGGVGKTMVAVNLAVLLADQGYETLLLDGDLAMANAAVQLGVTPRWGLEDVIDGSCSLNDARLIVEKQLTLLSAAGRRAELARRSGRFVGRLLNHIRDWNETPDFMVIDTAAGADDDVIYWTLAADQLVVVVSPEPTSLTDAHTLLRVLRETGFAGKVAVVVNAAASLEARHVFESLMRMVHLSLDLEVVYLGNIPSDPAVARAVRLHRPVARVSPRGPAGRALQALVAPVVDWLPRKEHTTLARAVGAWARRVVQWEALTSSR